MVKTLITFEDASKIINNYDLGKLITLTPIEHGNVQTNYKCICEKSYAVLRIYENREYNSILFETDILKQTSDNGFKCPMPYTKNSGEIIGEINGKNYVLYEFIEGEHIENPSDIQKTELIETVAKFNIATKNIRSKYEKYRMNYDVDFCREFATVRAREINDENAYKKLSWYLRELENLELPKEMAKSICHGDFHFTNLLYKNSKFNGLIDFDDANYTYACFDLVCLLDPFGKNGFDWHNYESFSEHDEVFDFSKAKRVLEKYLKINPFKEVDLEHIFDVLALSVLIDCLWFFDRGNANDFFEKRKIEYLKNLGRDKFNQNIL